VSNYRMSIDSEGEPDQSLLTEYSRVASMIVDGLVISNGGQLTETQAMFTFDLLVDGMVARQLTREEVVSLVPIRWIEGPIEAQVLRSEYVDEQDQ
jgi:hypothetical protein